MTSYIMYIISYPSTGGVETPKLVIGALKGPIALGRLLANVENSAGVTPNFIDSTLKVRFNKNYFSILLMSMHPLV